MGSVHQSGGCFRTASSPICGKKEYLIFSFFPSHFFHAGSPICDNFYFFASSFFHTCCSMELTCHSPKWLKYFSPLIFSCKVLFAFFVGIVQYIINKKLIWFRFIFSILTIESRGFWIRCFLLLNQSLGWHKKGKWRTPLSLKCTLYRVFFFERSHPEKF